MQAVIDSVRSCDAESLAQCLACASENPPCLDFYLPSTTVQETPLHRAVSLGGGGLELTQILLRSSASVSLRRYPDRRRIESMSASTLAVALRGLVEGESDPKREECLIRLLLEHHADPSEATSSLSRLPRILEDKSSPLAICAQLSNPKILSLLIEYKAEVNQTTFLSRRNHVGAFMEITESPLHVAILSSSQHKVECVQRLLDANASVSALRREKSTIYGWDFMAGGEDNVDTLTSLLPIHLAVNTGNYELCFLLCAYGADPKAKGTKSGKLCNTEILMANGNLSQRSTRNLRRCLSSCWSPQNHKLFPKHVREYYKLCAFYLRYRVHPNLPLEIVELILQLVPPKSVCKIIK